MAAAQEGRMNDIKFSLGATALCDAAGLGVQQARRHPQHEAVVTLGQTKCTLSTFPFFPFHRNVLSEVSSHRKRMCSEVRYVRHALRPAQPHSITQSHKG